MKVAIPMADGRLCMHFGHCQQFALVDVDEAAGKPTDTTLLTPPMHEPGRVAAMAPRTRRDGHPCQRHGPAGTNVVCPKWESRLSSARRPTRPRTLSRPTWAEPWSRAKTPAIIDMAKTRVTVLIENTARGPDILAQHGLSYWIEHDGHRVLFDTGQGNVLAGNAYKLGISLRESDALVLSHGHYDHAGGAAEALNIAPSMTVYAHPAAFERKFIRQANGPARECGMPYVSQEAIRSAKNQWVTTERPTTLFAAEKGDSPHLCEAPEGPFRQMGTVPFFRGGLTATGPVPRLTDFEDTGGPFFLDEACTQPDPLDDDQSLFFDTAEGRRGAVGLRPFGRDQHIALHPPPDRRSADSHGGRGNAFDQRVIAPYRADHRGTQTNRRRAIVARALHGFAGDRGPVECFPWGLYSMLCWKDL